MSIRVTTNALATNVLRDLESLQGKLSATQEKLSSGKRITKPSDDPYGTGLALGLRGELSATGQYASNVQDAIAWTNTTDTALSGMNDLLKRARDLVVRGATGTLDQSSRNAIAEEIDQIVAGVRQQANATYNGRYVLAGTAEQSVPYPPGSDAYGGDAQPVVRQIGPSTSVTINQNAGDLLGAGSTSNDGLALDTLEKISQHLRSGTAADIDTLGNADLANLDGVLDKLGIMRAQVGAVSNRLSLAQDRLQQAQTTATANLTSVEDADMTQVLIDYSTQSNAYQAALKAGANLIQPSLMDFLS
ncbi:MAG TPA: flagellar hook-associated protein FlgL [Solirubrobacteraceae bacterium]|jgi:flagellar hook-associated protein 3 FlgL|nr:flagellar hook-associated protein FlgL [Solirubrobacteraceae bacterium]